MLYLTSSVRGWRIAEASSHVLVLFRRWLRVKWWRTIVLLTVRGVWWQSQVCTHKTLYSAASASSSTRTMRNHGSRTSDASTAAWWEHHLLLLDKCFFFWNMILITGHIFVSLKVRSLWTPSKASAQSGKNTPCSPTPTFDLHRDLWPSSHVISTFSKHHLRTERKMNWAVLVNSEQLWDSMDLWYRQEETGLYSRQKKKSSHQYETIDLKWIMLCDGKQALFNISLENGNFFAETYCFCFFIWKKKVCCNFMNVMFKQ